jgi:hypothetical protein
MTVVVMTVRFVRFAPMTAHLGCSNRFFLNHMMRKLKKTHTTKTPPSLLHPPPFHVYFLNGIELATRFFKQPASNVKIFFLITRYTSLAARSLASSSSNS